MDDAEALSLLRQHRRAFLEVMAETLGRDVDDPTLDDMASAGAQITWLEQTGKTSAAQAEALRQFVTGRMS